MTHDISAGEIAKPAVAPYRERLKTALETVNETHELVDEALGSSPIAPSTTSTPPICKTDEMDRMITTLLQDLNLLRSRIGILVAKI